MTLNAKSKLTLDFIVAENDAETRETIFSGRLTARGLAALSRVLTEHRKEFRWMYGHQMISPGAALELRVDGAPVDHLTLDSLERREDDYSKRLERWKDVVARVTT